MRCLISVILVLLCDWAGAQVVWTEPAFPSQSDDVTVYFDASEGDGGLAGFSGDVYAHTGVITSASTGATDWKYVQGQWGVEFPRTLMTAEGEDLYSISYNIEEFYAVPGGEAVEQMAFVFRNVDGSVTGRAADGSDIYTGVFPPNDGLRLTIFSPSEEGAVIYDDDSLYVQVDVNQRAYLQVLDNEEEVYSDSTESVGFFISEALSGGHELEFRVSSGSDSLQVARQYFVLERGAVDEDQPFSVPMGLTYHTDSTYVFQLYAPEKEHVFLLCPENGFGVDPRFLMKRAEDRATFWLELPRSLISSETAVYQYLVDGELRIADPYSTVVLDPSNDQWVPAAVLAELPPYPTGMTSGIVTAFDFEDEEFPWTDFSEYTIPSSKNLVVYELLMRDFLDDKNYASLLDTLDYLERLGITAIELMPINEFEGNQSWGYNCSFHMALDKYYGSRDQFKQVVDAAHSRGIAVIMDVVYNHVFSQSPLAQLYWDSANFRPTEDNPWLNVNARHPFNVGYDVNHESDATKLWVKQTLRYWMSEFHIDGFRFDLSKGFTQRNSIGNDDLMAQYDAGRIAILKDYADLVWSVNPDAYVILEHFAYNEEEKELADYGMMLWGNLHWEFVKAVKEQASDLEWLDYRVRDWNEPNVMGYMESHDEERLIVELENSGFSLEEALDKVEAASAIFYLVPGPKMLWQFGELGFDYSINWCVNGTVNGCRLDPKPVVWDYLEEEGRMDLRDVVANILDLKKNYPTFSSDDYEFNDGNLYLKTIHFNHEEMDALVMANFRDKQGDLIPKFQYPGVWYEYFSGDSLVVEDVDARLPLQSGEYRIYTSERITPVNGFTTSVSDFGEEVNAAVFPNPVSAGAVVRVSSDQRVKKVELIDGLGRSIVLAKNQAYMRIPAKLGVGIYYLRVENGEGSVVRKLVVE